MRIVIVTGGQSHAPAVGNAGCPAVFFSQAMASLVAILGCYCWENKPRSFGNSNTRRGEKMKTIMTGAAAAIFGLVTLSASADARLVIIDQAVVKAAGGFPYRITQPGSYRLSSNLQVPAGVNGILIDASNVLLNLDGFQITYAGGQSTGIFSDSASPAYANLTIRNGNVTGCWTAIDLEYTTYATVDAVTASNYGVLGIQVLGGAIRKSSATGGSDPHSIGLALSSGIVDSNLEMNDYVGISIYQSGRALVVGNVVVAT